MITKVRYVVIPTYKGNKRIGVIHLCYKDGKIGLGISICHPEDKFDKEIGKKIAEERALDCWVNTPLKKLYDYEAFLTILASYNSSKEIFMIFGGVLIEMLHDLSFEIAKHCMRKEYRD